MRNVLKMVYGNQKEVKLESQVFEFGGIKEVSVFQKEADSLYKEMVSKGEKFKKEYRNKTDSLQKPFNQLRVELYNNMKSFLKKVEDLGIDGKSTPPYKKMQKLIKDIDQKSDFFSKEYTKLF